MNAIIIGAGPAGLTAGYQIAKQTDGVSVFEADQCVGGMARSFTLWGQTVDVGPHRFFSKDRKVNELWLEVVGRDYAMVKRNTRILYQGKLFHYPLEATDALWKLGPIKALGCIASYAKESMFPTQQDGSFESWVCRRFGRKLFEAFFKSYSEKLWGIRCNELDADFAAQRIKKFSLLAAIKGAFSSQQQKKHRTLADEFAYPFEGTGCVYTRMAEAIRRNGGSVHLKNPVRKVLLSGNKIRGVQLVNGEELESNHVISSMPLTTLVKQLDDAPREIIEACDQLRFRNTILVYLEVLDENPFPDNWIYVHSPDLQFGRVTNFRNWAPQICGGSPNAILAMEYWCNSDEEMWRKTDAALIDQAKREILSSKLVSHPSKINNGFVLRVPKSYPVYHRGYQKTVDLIKEYLATIEGLQVIGRYGAFKYNNQDHSILMGLLAAENVLSSKVNNLWEINSDYESYQEECSISETGLVTA